MSAIWLARSFCELDPCPRRKASTSYRRCPLSVRMWSIFPAFAQALKVFSCTPSLLHAMREASYAIVSVLRYLLANVRKSSAVVKPPPLGVGWFMVTSHLTFINSPRMAQVASWLAKRSRGPVVALLGLVWLWKFPGAVGGVFSRLQCFKLRFITRFELTAEILCPDSRPSLPISTFVSRRYLKNFWGISPTISVYFHWY